MALASWVPGASCATSGVVPELSTVTDALVGVVWVIVLGVTVSAKDQVPLSPLPSTSVPFKLYVPAARYPLVFTIPLKPIERSVVLPPVAVKFTAPLLPVTFNCLV